MLIYDAGSKEESINALASEQFAALGASGFEFTFQFVHINYKIPRFASGTGLILSFEVVY